MKERTKTFVTEYGEKYKELNKKIATQVQMKIPPSKTRTFACNYGIGIAFSPKYEELSLDVGQYVGFKSAYKKAIVKLAEGDKIAEFDI